MPPDLMRLFLPVPPAFAQTLGYTGSSRYVAFCWTPVGDDLIYSDGDIGDTGDDAPWLLWTRHPTVAPALLGFDVGDSDTQATHGRLLDQQEACCYVGTAQAVAHFLREQPEIQARRGAWERLSFAEQQDALFEDTAGLTPLPQQRVTITREDRERRSRASQQRCHALTAWLERPS